jgi:hypothetical protein
MCSLDKYYWGYKIKKYCMILRHVPRLGEAKMHTNKT